LRYTYRADLVPISYFIHPFRSHFQSSIITKIFKKEIFCPRYWVSQLLSFGDQISSPFSLPKHFLTFFAVSINTWVINRDKWTSTLGSQLKCAEFQNRSVTLMLQLSLHSGIVPSLTHHGMPITTTRQFQLWCWRVLLKLLFFCCFFFFKRVVCFNGSYSHMITAQLQLGKAFNNRHYFTPHLAISLLLEFSGHIHSQIAWLIAFSKWPTQVSL